MHLYSLIGLSLDGLMIANGIGSGKGKNKESFLMLRSLPQC
ncbi:Hypothetical protein NATL1_13961 [Prochlorococcus marinus str. NATL1A]|uniref:Uncharacterized protein n=1 Tax=Prochlorococcus marinus (strain NATL1A) TaxID=167555 RepID=A2C394_PROM1|nr:Hypothetical protein NATL1_13961 [Prochlorococcus marinus str. NATL1A]